MANSAILYSRNYIFNERWYWKILNIFSFSNYTSTRHCPQQNYLHFFLLLKFSFFMIFSIILSSSALYIIINLEEKKIHRPVMNVDRWCQEKNHLTKEMKRRRRRWANAKQNRSGWPRSDRILLGIYLNLFHKCQFIIPLSLQTIFTNLI